MAAPIVTSSQQQATLKKLRSKENVQRKTHKNLLCIERREWPRPAQSVEEDILHQLSEKLKTIPRIFKPVKPQLDVGRDEKVTARSQLAIGTSSVFRALEKDELSCVLVSGQAVPAIAVDHIILLGQERGCPLLCLDQLSVSVAKATESKCYPLTIGFKKIQTGVESVFADVIQTITDHAPTAAPQKAVPLPTADSVQAVSFKQNRFKPCRISAEKETEILEELKTVFSKALVTQSRNRETIARKGKRKRQKKRNLKDAFEKSCCLQFEVGKRTVTNILERGKLKLILVSEEMCPVLVSETQSYSLLSLAAHMQCPILALRGLADTLRPIFQARVSVLAFKKPSTLPPECLFIFGTVVQHCFDVLNELDPAQQSWSVVTASKPSSLTTASETVPSATLASQGDSAEHNKTRSDKDSKLADATEVDEDEEDYTNWYILKEESKELAEVRSKFNAEFEELKKNSALSSDFISFSSNSKVVNEKPTGRSTAKSSTASNNHVGLSTETVTESSQPPGNSPVFNSVDSGEKPFHEKQMVDSEKGSFTEFLDFVSSKTTDVEDSNNEEDVPLTENSIEPDISALGKSPSVAFFISTSGSSVKDISVTDSASSTKEAVLASPLFSICRSGNRDTDSAKKEAGDPLAGKAKGYSSGSNVNSTDSEVVFGLSDLPPAATDITGDHLPLSETSKKAKKSAKRKIQGDDSFISFTYTEANIRTMTSNPSKKRKKKKK